MASATQQNDTPTMNRWRRARRRTAGTFVVVRLNTNRGSKIAAFAPRIRSSHTAGFGFRFPCTFGAVLAAWRPIAWRAASWRPS